MSERERFREALDVVLEHEGGFVDHPDDPGGRTNRGVTQRVYDAHRRASSLPERSVEGITSDEVEAIYYGRYWKKARCGEWGRPLDLVVFDAAVNHGPSRAVELLQGVSGASVDGVVGPETRQQVHAHDPRWLASRLLWRRAELYAEIVSRRRSQAAFIRGWIRRVKGLSERVA